MTRLIVSVLLHGAIALTVFSAYTPASLAAAHPAWFPSNACAPERVRYDIAGAESYQTYAARAQRRTCYKPWTVLVYMAADNNLAPYALWDLYEMEAGYRSGRLAAGSTGRSDLLVQLAMPASSESRRVHIFQSPDVYDNQLTMDDFRLRTEADIHSPVAAMIPRRENGAPIPAAQDLKAFLEWGIREYPAEHYMVIVWGHGQGWAPASKARVSPPAVFSQRRFGGLAFSDSQGTFLDTPSLHKALRAVENKLLAGQPIDVYASDACLMQMIEVATEISDSSRFIIGSSQVQNFVGLPYRRMMYEINVNRFAEERSAVGVAGSDAENDEAYLLAKMLPRIFRLSLQPGGLHARLAPDAIQTVTMSSIATSELRGSMLPALGDLGRALKTFIKEEPLRAIDVQAMLQKAPTFMGGAQEIGSFLTLLRQLIRRELDRQGSLSPGAQELGAAIDESAAALNRTVVAYSLGTRYSGNENQLYLLGFRALSVWLPVSEEDFSGRIADFSSSRFYRELSGSWRDWLSKIYKK